MLCSKTMAVSCVMFCCEQMNKLIHVLPSGGEYQLACFWLVISQVGFYQRKSSSQMLLKLEKLQKQYIPACWDQGRRLCSVSITPHFNAWLDLRIAFKLFQLNREKKISSSINILPLGSRVGIEWSKYLFDSLNLCWSLARSLSMTGQ